MTKVLELNTVKDTTLWKRLSTGFVKSQEKDVAAELATQVANLCEVASDPIKVFPYFHPQFTLHDQTHLLRVTELMAREVGSGLNSLNALEVALLILSAHFHDQGMVPDVDEWKRIQASPSFKLSWQRWEIEHPMIHDLKHHIGDARFSRTEKEKLNDKLHELKEAHQTDFLRETHGERSEEIVSRLFGESDSLVVAGTNLAPWLGRLCASHVWPAERLNSFRADQSIGSLTVNLRFLALVLRPRVSS